MRCLHCGNTLSALKKLTDSGFCSTDHRDVFYGDQQPYSHPVRAQASVFNGLAEDPPNGNAAAITGRRCTGGSVPGAGSARCVSLRETGKFRSPSPLLFFSVFLNASTLIFPPAPSRRSGRVRLFASLVSDFPWPRYNPGLKAFLDLLAVTDARTIGFSSSLRVNGFVSSNIDPARYFPRASPMRPAWFSPDRLYYGWRGQSRRSRSVRSTLR